MGRRSGSGHWRRHQTSEHYLERAAREGWRSRAVYKLEEIHARERLLRRGQVCVDLGASPGGWSQFAARIVGPAGRVWAVDVEPIEPIAGVSILRGDINDPGTVAALRAAMGDARAQLVMSDMAPNISGNRAVDQARSMALADAARALATDVLEDGGDLIIKLFQGEGFEAFVSEARRSFGVVRVIKPRASRPESREMYLLARRYGM